MLNLIHKLEKNIIHNETKEIQKNIKEVIKLILKSKLIIPVLHPLGFILFNLGEVQSGTLRLHIWLKDYHSPQSQDFLIHKHKFALKSCILYGGIKNDIYKRNDIHKGKNYSLYSVTYESENNISILTKTDKKIFLEKAEESIYKKKDVYQMNIEDYHTITPINDFTATLCLTYNHQSINPMVIGSSKGEEEYIYTRDSSDTNHILENILPLLLRSL